MTPLLYVAALLAATLASIPAFLIVIVTRYPIDRWRAGDRGSVWIGGLLLCWIVGLAALASLFAVLLAARYLWNLA